MFLRYEKSDGAKTFISTLNLKRMCYFYYYSLFQSTFSASDKYFIHFYKLDNRVISQPLSLIISSYVLRERLFRVQWIGDQWKVRPHSGSLHQLWKSHVSTWFSQVSTYKILSIEWLIFLSKSLSHQPDTVFTFTSFVLLMHRFL